MGMLSFRPHLMHPDRIDVPTPSGARAVTIGSGARDRLGATLEAIGAPARRYAALTALNRRHLDGERAAAPLIPDIETIRDDTARRAPEHRVRSLQLRGTEDLASFYRASIRVTLPAPTCEAFVAPEWTAAAGADVPTSMVR